MPTYYNLGRASLAELFYSTPWFQWPLLLLVLIFRLFRLPTNIFSHDPAVDSVASFEVDASALPEHVRARFSASVAELAPLGFSNPISYAIVHRPLGTSIYWAVFVHAEKKVLARVVYIEASLGMESAIRFYPVFISEYGDNTFLVTSAGKLDSYMPANVFPVHRRGMSAAKLWQLHQRRLESRPLDEPIRHNDPTQVRRCVERLHTAISEFHYERGYFTLRTEPMPPEPVAVPQEDGSVVSADDIAVLTELKNLIDQKPNVWGFLLVLAVSVAGSVYAAKGDRTPFLWTMIGVLFFHELGHFVAMRLFGYRNVRMFFIPFLGAAVTGKHYNVAGWKKAIVALAGPLPGTVVGLPLSIVALKTGQHQLSVVALTLLALNWINLLPILPLDGGWFVHAVLFCRHPLLDVLFRAFAIGLLFLWCAITLSPYLVAFPVGMLLGLPMTWLAARTAYQLRSRDDLIDSEDGQSIPLATALAILDQLRPSLKSAVNPKFKATMVMRVFEVLNARPPKLLTTLALLTTYAVTFFAPAILLVVWVIAFGPLQQLLNKQLQHVAEPPKHRYERGDTEVWGGVKRPPRAESHTTLLATYIDAAAAKAAFQTLPADLPADSTLRRFGSSLIVSLPNDDRAACEQRLTEDGATIVVDRLKSRAHVRLSLEAADDATCDRIEKTLNEYFSQVCSPMLMPPWSKAWRELPEKDRQRYTKARSTAVRLANLRTKAEESPEVAKLRADLFKGGLFAGGKARIERAKAWRKACDDEEQRLRDALREEGEESLDLDVFDLWTRYMKSNAMQPADGEEKPGGADQPMKFWQARRDEQADLARQMALRMGSLPLKGDQPRHGSDNESVHNSYAHREGQLIHVESLKFVVIEIGLPALAEWLYEIGGSNLRYEFVAGYDEEEI